MIEYVPAAEADTLTVQLDWLAPDEERAHDPPVTPLPPETVTVPEGADAVPVGSVSVTVTVAVLPCATRTVVGESASALVV